MAFNIISKRDIIDIIETQLLSDDFVCISTVNLEFIMLAQKNREFKDFLNNISKINTIDGVGIINVLKWYNINKLERLCGSDLVYNLAELCQKNNKKYFILGASEESSIKAKEKLKEMYSGLEVENYSPPYTPNLKFSEDEEEKIKGILKEYKPDVLCVAFGAPKQELWIKEHLDFLKELGVKIAIGLGGSFDFIAGKVQRAPEIFKKTGNEWLYRLIKEPKTKFKRQITTIPLYYLLCFGEFVRKKDNEYCSIFKFIVFYISGNI